jgi:hypothetical protein
MKFYVALILSAAIHLAAVFFVSDTSTLINSVKHDQSILFVSIKHALARPISSNVNLKSTNKVATPINPFADYLSEHDVEMKALPTNNIDETKLEGVFISGLPIKMRLYINNEGRVVKVDKLNVLAQDRPLQAALEKILREMPFFPAKKNGVSVNSYQEIAFEFR